MKTALLYTPLIALLLALMSCSMAENGKSAATDSIAASVTANDTGVVASVDIALPGIENDTLRLAALLWANEALGGTYTGPLTDAEVLAKHYAAEAADILRQNRAVLGNPAAYRLTYAVSIRAIAQTDNYLTLLATTDSYDGGAHGSRGVSGVTLLAANGARLSWRAVLSAETHPSLDALIAAGLRDYFKVATDEALAQCLISETGVNVGVPACPPLLMPDGIRCIYGQYEIAPFAAGLPTFTLPYKSAPLSPLTKALLPSAK